MYARPPVVALRQTLRDVIAFKPSLSAESRRRVVQEEVFDVVDDLKAEGWRPERIVIAVKQIAADAGLLPSTGLFVLSTTANESDEIILDLVRWSIERYYHDADDSAR